MQTELTKKVMTLEGIVNLFQEIVPVKLDLYKKRGK